MKFQDSSFNGFKVTVGTKSVMHAPTHAHSKSNMLHQLFQSWGHNEYPCKPQFHNIKVGCKGVLITQTCYPDAVILTLCFLELAFNIV